LHPEGVPPTFLIRPARLCFGLLKIDYEIGADLAGLKGQAKTFNTFGADKLNAEIVLGHLFVSQCAKTETSR
jgi:hypothetical protein